MPLRDPWRRQYAGTQGRTIPGVSPCRYGAFVKGSPRATHLTHGAGPARPGGVSYWRRQGWSGLSRASNIKGESWGQRGPNTPAICTEKRRLTSNTTARPPSECRPTCPSRPHHSSGAGSGVPEVGLGPSPRGGGQEAPQRPAKPRQFTIVVRPPGTTCVQARFCSGAVVLFCRAPARDPTANRRCS